MFRKYLTLLLVLLLSGLMVLPLAAQDDGDADEDAMMEEEMAEEVGFDPEVCFAAAPENDGTVQIDAREGPYTIGLSNSFVGNAWRTQMIQMAQAFAAQPEVAEQIEELIIVSSGQDVEAQIAAMDNMIALGVDAIVLNAATPTGFDAVIRRADQAGIPVISFDNVVTAPEAVLVNENQIEFGAIMATDLVERMGGEGNVVMINGVPGTSVDQDRQTGAEAVFAESEGIEVIAELEGRWDSGTAQTVMADFLATQPEIDGVWVQGGTPGVLQAFTDAEVELVPMAGEAENAFRIALAENDDLGGISVGQTPGMGAVSIQVALNVLQGVEVPRVIAMPIPAVTSEDAESGVHYFPELPDDFFTPIKIPECGVNLEPEAILQVEVEG